MRSIVFRIHEIHFLVITVIIIITVVIVIEFLFPPFSVFFFVVFLLHFCTFYFYCARPSRLQRSRVEIRGGRKYTVNPRFPLFFFILFFFYFHDPRHRSLRIEEGILIVLVRDARDFDRKHSLGGENANNWIKKEFAFFAGTSQERVMYDRGASFD